MSHRVNIMLDDEIWTALQEISPGERSRFLNEAAGEPGIMYLKDWR